jgi:predicted Zn-dependent protease
LRLFAAVVVALSLVACRQAQAASLIRDAETESLIRDYAKPIFQVAGLGAQNIQIHIVNDRSFNAFVVDGHNMFINAGTIMDATTPNQVIGVIAHECGHIADGHLARLRAEVARAKSTALMLQILGLAAAAAGAVAGNPNTSGAGMGIAAGGNEAAMRFVLAYQQNEESSADQAGVRFLTESHQSGIGMLQSFENLARKSMGINGINPFLQNHPMPEQRLAQLRRLVESSPYYETKDPPALQFRHDLVRAKLFGFIESPETVFNRYPESDQSFPAYYARAIATYRQSGLEAALPLLNALINGQPDWPYFHELKGQFEFESGHAAQAIPELRTAVKLAPDQPLIRVLLGQALLAIPSPANVDEAITNLQYALAHEPDSSMGYRQLAMAYGYKADLASPAAKKDYLARADLASAEAYFYEGQIALAKVLAKRAKKGFAMGTPTWLQADDIVTFQMPGTN